jgi:hypothetical protein
MLLEMDLETTIYVTGIAVVFFQCFYLNFRLKQVTEKLDKIVAELAELRQLGLSGGKEMGGQS